MNGRELTANDIEFNFHRYLGIGSGFSEASPFAGQLPKIESVTATDASTVVFKLAEPDLFALDKLVNNRVAWIYPPEVIQQYGDLQDWRNLVGTGPMEPDGLRRRQLYHVDQEPHFYRADSFSGYNNDGLGVNDPHMNALVDAAKAATTLEERNRLVKEANLYAVGQHWHIDSPGPVPQFNVAQPWVKGYNGEFGGSSKPFSAAGRVDGSGVSLGALSAQRRRRLHDGAAGGG